MNEMKFSEKHEWARVDEAGIATVGISDYAQKTIGDLVFIELPQVGDRIEQGQEAGVIESVKAANDLYTPVSGEVVEINPTLGDSPDLVNQDAHEKGWLFKIKLADATQLDALMDETAYQEFISTLE